MYDHEGNPIGINPNDINQPAQAAMSLPELQARQIAEAQEAANRREALRIPADLKGHKLWDRKNVQILDFGSDKYTESEALQISDLATMLREVLASAQASEDPSTKVGAALYNSDSNDQALCLNRAVNTLPPSFKSEERQEIWNDAARKYDYCIHAEVSCIYGAVNSKRGDMIAGSTMFCTWAACLDCAKVITSFGISAIVVPFNVYGLADSKWDESIAKAFDLFEKAGVAIIAIRGELGQKVTMNGQTTEV